MKGNYLMKIIIFYKKGIFFWLFMLIIKEIKCIISELIYYFVRNVFFIFCLIIKEGIVLFIFIYFYLFDIFFYVLRELIVFD